MVRKSPFVECEEKVRLGIAYEAATKNFSSAVSELQENIGASSQAEYVRLTRAADKARSQSEQERCALEQHTNTYHCWARTHPWSDRVAT
jgi:hypothetical protein